MSRVWCIGAGYVGGGLARTLAADGHAVWAFRRSFDAPILGVECISGDARDANTYRGIEHGPDMVVYSVAAKTPGPNDPAESDVYGRGLECVLGELGRRGVSGTRFVLTSSTGVYDVDDGRWVDEETEIAARSPRALRLLAAEQRLLDSPCEAVVVRLAGIYGPGRTSLVDRVRTDQARRPRAPKWTNRIHRHDAVMVLRHVLGLREPARCYVASDHEPKELGDVLEWLAGMMGKPVPPLENEGESEGSRSYRGDSNKRCRSDRLRASGFRFRYPTFREGYGALLAEMAETAS